MTQTRNTHGHAGVLDRPLSPRSLVASLLLGVHPPRLPSALLVRWCAQFGVAEGTTRVAISRMTDRGELVGAEGVYTLAGSVGARQRWQDWALAPEVEALWTGQWRLHIVDTRGRPAGDRARLRSAALRLRLIEIREGVWVRPDNLPPAADPPEARDELDARTITFRGAADFDTEDLVRRFGVEAWADRARLLIDRMDETMSVIEATDATATDAAANLPEAFYVLAATLQHVRADPLLPAELLPVPWPGDDLRAAYRRHQAVFEHAVAEWFRAVRG